MALRFLTCRVFSPYIPTIRNTATLAVLRGYATKRYTAAHDWISVENGVGTVGITDHAQKELGDVVFVETPIIGDSVEIGGHIGIVESVKAASDILSPVSGEVISVNEVLADDPSLINTSPEDEGWLAKIKLSDPDELTILMDEKAYAAHCASDEDH